MKLSQLISISTVYAAAEGASTQGRRPRREAPSITCPPSWVLDPNDSTNLATITDYDNGVEVHVGMLPIVRSGPRQVKLVQTTRSSRTTPNADQSFWELQQKKTNMCQALQILMLFLNSPLSNSPKPKLAKRCICNATSKSASSSKTVNQRAVNVKMVISVCKKYCEWTALLLVLNKTQQDNYFSLFLHSLSHTFISAIKFTYFVCTLFLFCTKNIRSTSYFLIKLQLYAPSPSFSNHSHNFSRVEQ